MTLKKSRRDLLLNVLPAFLGFSYGSYIVYLFIFKKLDFFVHPDYTFLTLGTGVLLLILSLLAAIDGVFLHHRSLTCSYAEFYLSKPRNIFLLFLPLILALFVQPHPLSTVTAALRSSGLNNDAAFSRQSNRVSPFDINTENRSIVDWIRLFTQDPEPDHYKGMKTKLDGFVMHSNTLPPDYFLISRFVISCCAADARPVGIPVHYDPKKFQPKDDEWIEVQGVFDVDTIEQERQPVVNLLSYTDISVPDNPYEN